MPHACSGAPVIPIAGILRTGPSMHAVPRLGRCAPCRLRPTISRAFRCLATAEALPSWSPDPSTWKSPDSWVVFSDLHLSPSTAPTCMRVLDLVHAEAVSRNAGILFLGALGCGTGM